MQFALFIFSFLTIVGAFSAWRKSPLYSLGSSLKLVGAFLLIVVVVVGTSPAIPDDHITDLPMMHAAEDHLSLSQCLCSSECSVVVQPTRQESCRPVLKRALRRQLINI